MTKLHGDTKHAEKILELSNDLQDQIVFAEFDDDGNITRLTPEEQINKPVNAGDLFQWAESLPAYLRSGQWLPADLIFISGSGLYPVPMSTSGQLLYSEMVQITGASMTDNGDPIL